ncbi:hypothetical protein OEZ86_010548 [Tetradesmus obliquus]|nr:hypothetical protein OEZ86_010548 [Tetradesmus obliquus]
MGGGNVGKALQIVDQADAKHKAALAKATYKIHLCVVNGELLSYDVDNSNMLTAETLCLTPVGSQLHITWHDLDFRISRSDAAASQEILDLVFSSWRTRSLEHDEEPYLEEEDKLRLNHMAAVGGRIYMIKQGTEVNGHRRVDFDFSDEDAAQQAIKAYMAPLRHLAPPRA